VEHRNRININKIYNNNENFFFSENENTINKKINKQFRIQPKKVRRYVKTNASNLKEQKAK